MEHLAQQDKRIEHVKYLEISPDIIRLPDVRLTMGVSNRRGIMPVPVAAGLDMLDLEVIYRRTNWHDPPVIERRKAAHKCEILVPDHVPIEFIRNLD